MTNTGETANPGDGWSWLPLVGSVMVCAGLGMMLTIIMGQQKQIDDLLSQRGTGSAINT